MTFDNELQQAERRIDELDRAGRYRLLSPAEDKERRKLLELIAPLYNVCGKMAQGTRQVPRHPGAE